MADNFWYKFYFKEWLNDTKVLSLTARGLLNELIIYLKQSDPVGTMPVDIRFISRLTGGLTEEITESLAEFRKYGVLSFEISNGQEFLISRRIIKENLKSLVNTENGKKGGNPGLSNSVNRNHNRGVKARDNRSPNSNSIFNSNSLNKKESKKKVEIIFPFSSEDFYAAWSKWIQYRHDIKKPYKSDLSVQGALNELLKYSEAEAIEMIEYSIRKAYQGIYKEDKKIRHEQGNTVKESTVGRVPISKAADFVNARSGEALRSNGEGIS